MEIKNIMDKNVIKYSDDFKEISIDDMQNIVKNLNRIPQSGDDKEYILYVVDNKGDTPYDYVTVGWHLNGYWIVNNEICHDEVVAWIPLLDVKYFRNKIENLKNILRFKVGDIVNVEDDDGYSTNVLIVEIDNNGIIRGLDKRLKEYYISAEYIKHVKNTDTQIDVKNIMDTIKSAVTK